MSAEEFLKDVMPAAEEVRQDVSEEDKAAYFFHDELRTYWELTRPGILAGATIESNFFSYTD